MQCPRNALGLLFVGLVLAGSQACTPAGPAPPKTIVLISLDTLRAGRLGVYGNSADVSPQLDAIAQRGVVFEDALAPAPWTLPSHMSLLTGLDPVAHGVRGESDVLAGEIATVAERLREAGYATGAFTDGGFVSAHYGFGRGFDRYDDARSANGPNGFRRLLPEVHAWIDAQADTPFFLFVHSLDAHAPYDDADPETQAAFRARPNPDGPDDHLLITTRYLMLLRSVGLNRYGRLSGLLNDYDAGVHVADRGVGAIAAQLRRIGRFEDALFVVTSDHGESFLERGPWVGHGLRLTDDEIGIPLVVKLPGDEAAGTRIETPVDLLDVAATLLDVAGLPIDTLEGESLRELVRGSPRSRAEIFGESANTGAFFLVHDGMKYVTATRDDAMTIARTHLGPVTPPLLMGDAPGSVYSMGGVGRGTQLHYDDEGDPLALRDSWARGPLLYDRRADPEERHNLHDVRPEQAAALRRRLATRLKESLALAPLPDAPAPELSEAEQAALEALGYLGPAGSAVADQLPRDPGASPAAPDMSPLIEQDRAVHTIRLRALAGRPVLPEAAAQLERAAEVYRSWGTMHPDARWRAEWRLRELRAVATRTGVER